MILEGSVLFSRLAQRSEFVLKQVLLVPHQRRKLQEHLKSSRVGPDRQFSKTPLMTMTSKQEKRIGSFRADARTHAHERLEGARDLVEEIDLPALADWYDRYDDWDIKSNILGIMQDYKTPEVFRVMTHFLSAPPSNEFRRLHQAVALDVLENHGSFQRTVETLRKYQRDEELLRRDVQEKLRQLGRETLPEFPKPDRSVPPGVQAVALSKCESPDLARTLLEAIKMGDFSGVQAALAAGASVHVYDEKKPFDGCTPLMVAVINKDPSLVELLLKAGSNVNHLRPKMFSPPYSGQSALWLAAEHGNKAMVETLLQHGPVLDSSPTNGHTPLYRALLGGWVDIAKLLRDAGASVVGRTHPHRRTFLHSLVANGHANMVELLLEFGASPEEVDDCGVTPLLLAAELGDAEKIRVLLKAGAALRTTHRGYDEHKPLLGMCPLAIAVTFDHLEALKALVEAGGDLQTVVGEALQHDGSVLPKRALTDLAKAGSAVAEYLRSEA